MDLSGRRSRGQVDMSAAPAAQRRIRRPKDKAELFDRLQQGDSPFTTMRDVLLFAAGLGWSRERRIPFDRTDEPIHWHTMTSRPGAEPLINMLALSQTDDVTILSEERFEERALMFEEYANGGLEVLRELVANSPKSVVDIVQQLVRQAADIGTDNPDRIDLSEAELEF